MLRRQVQLSPIAGFPDEFAAWVPVLWAEVDGAAREREADEMMREMEVRRGR